MLKQTKDLIVDNILKESAIFPNQEALQKYLTEHPTADKNKHKVKPKSSDFKGREKNQLHYLNDAGAREAMDELNKEKRFKGLVNRNKDKSNKLDFINDRTRSDALELLHRKNLHKTLVEEK
jgi:hypothetical protein